MEKDCFSWKQNENLVCHRLSNAIHFPKIPYQMNRELYAYYPLILFQPRHTYFGLHFKDYFFLYSTSFYISKGVFFSWPMLLILVFVYFRFLLLGSKANKKWNIYLSIYLSIHFYINVYLYLFQSSYLYRSVHIYLSIYLKKFISFCLYQYLSIYAYINI